MPKKFLISILAVVLIVTIFGIVLWRHYHPTPSAPTNGQPAVIPEWYKTDKDGDTIPDEKEQGIGTNPNDSDTDGDTVPDQLEIDVYTTDPLKLDTDGDGYSDGVEIIKGFDPLTKATVNQ